MAPACPRCGLHITTSADFGCWCTSETCLYGKDDPRRMVPEADPVPTTLVRSLTELKPVGAMFFDAFWTAYPRKTAKATAKKSFERLSVTTSLLSTMLAAIEWQSKSKQWAIDGIIPHPATWLNQRRWEDEPPTALVPANGGGPGPMQPPRTAMARPPVKSFKEQERDRAQQLRRAGIRPTPAALPEHAEV